MCFRLSLNFRVIYICSFYNKIIAATFVVFTIKLLLQQVFHLLLNFMVFDFYKNNLMT